MRQAELYHTPWMEAGKLNGQTLPEGVDLIVCAHSHDFISEKTRLRATYGGIGYHPSLLPLHRGKDAIRWAIKMGDRITGGTVYRLSNKVDGGDILEQQWCFIRPTDDAQELWRRDLGPIGVDLLLKAVHRIAEHGFIQGHEQDEKLATWEPSMDAPPVHRPDLIMLGHDPAA
jgi:methionyl-tRNA formyltransferase